jgi:hypothetical protein
MSSKEHSGKGRKLVGPRKTSSRPARKTAPTKKFKVAKKEMIKSRQPLVETKSRIQSEISVASFIDDPKEFISAAAVFTPLPLHAYLNMDQGVGEDQMLGQSIFSRYLNAKVQIRFPGGDNLITDRQYPMELICGWIPSSMALSTFTTPNVTTVMPADLTAYVITRISEYFNARSDKLDFIPKHASNLRITYRKRIRPNQNRNTVMNPNSGPVKPEGNIPDVILYPKWKTNKKVFYEKGGALSGTRFNWYPNYSWIPFMILYTPMYAGEGGDDPVPTVKVPRVSYNVAHYYTDS